MKLNNVLTLLQKELIVEIRQKYALYGILLFTVSIVFIIYKSFNDIGPQTWNILVWLVTLFAGVNAIVKSFVQEKSDTYLYYYTLVDPVESIIAKLIYNIIFMIGLIAVIVLAFILFADNPIKDFKLFIIAVLLGAAGIGAVFTFVSSISGAAGQNATMMSILALPLVLPILLLLIKITSVAMRLMQDTSIGKDLWLLGGIDILLVGLILLLYPTVWKG